uniref:Uncharacterized protein n=1 Tax=Arundo donax TaxID=35708 RepID=A0A0A9B7T4_ARUDO
MRKIIQNDKVEFVTGIAHYQGCPYITVE